MIGLRNRFRTPRLSAPVLFALALAGFLVACDRPDHIEIDPRMPRLVHKGETVRLHGKMMDRRGRIFPTERASYSSRDPFIANVDANGEVGGLSSGHTVITARWQELSAEVPVEVDLVEAIRAVPTELTIKVDGDPVKLQVTPLGIDGRPRPDREVHLVSADPSIVRVDNDAQVWGLKLGEAVVHAKSDDKEAEIKVTVTK